MSQECEVSWYIGSEGVYQNLGGRKLVRGLARLPRYDWVSSQRRAEIVSRLAGSVTGQRLWSSWRAGRGRANLPGDDHHDVERRLNPHSLVLR